jgi:hypothetical protein
LVQDQGGVEFQPAGILKYVEDLKRRPNAEIGPKGFFEIASILIFTAQHVTRNPELNIKLTTISITAGT